MMGDSDAVAKKCAKLGNCLYYCRNTSDGIADDALTCASTIPVRCRSEAPIHHGDTMMMIMIIMMITVSS
jgi:hypothetical protein